MTVGAALNTAALLGCTVTSASGKRLGRITAVIHRGDGCDVLVQRRHWVRTVVVRLDADDLAWSERSGYRHAPRARTLSGPSDGRVA